MKELRLFLRKIDQKVISKGKHYLLTLIILYRYKTNEVLDHYKDCLLYTSDAADE